MNYHLITAVAIAAASLPIHAADFMDTAPVVSATPIVDRVVEPRQECAPVAPVQRAPQERSVVAPIVGGVAGAILGSTVGRGNGRTAATAVGAIGGAIIGDHVGNRQADVPQQQQQCRTVESTREIVRGYNVVYRYNGRDVATTMPYDPGTHVRVSVSAVDSSGQPIAPAPAAMTSSNTREAGAPRSPYDTRDAGYGPRPVYTEQPRAESQGNYSYRY